MNSYLNLIITFRLNVSTSQYIHWKSITLNQALDFIAEHQKLKKITEAIHQDFLEKEGWINSPYEDFASDFVITPKQLQKPFKQEFRKRKLLLPCILFFGEFLPPSSAPQLQGMGNGIVVVDIDLKQFGVDGPLHSDFVETVETLIQKFFYEHPSTIFLYHSISGLGFHMGFATGAIKPDEYERTFNALINIIGQAIPILIKDKVLDTNCSKHDRAFFVAHSPVVLRKEPTAIFPVPAVPLLPEPKAHDGALDLSDKKPVQGAYDCFPYNADFKLFLSFQRRNKDTEYFSDFKEWLTLIYALVNVYSHTFSERLLYWFETLSQLSSSYDHEHNREILEGILQGDIANETGLEYILYKLNGEQPVSSRSQYTVKEMESYFANLGSYHLSNFEFTNVIFIKRYLTEIKDQLSLHHNLVIESPPNSGKSTLFLEYFEGKIIFVVPSLILLEDLRKKVRPEKLQVIAQGVRAEDIDPSKQVILSTYEGLEKIQRAGLDLKSYTFVMDEAHQLFSASAPFFRFKTMRRIIKSLARFKNFIFITGTWIPFPFTNLPFTFIKIRFKKPVTTKLELISTPTPLDTLTIDVVKEKGKQVVLINNRKENEILKDKLQTLRPGTPVSIFNRDTKEEDEVKNILSINHLQEGEVMVGTQMIAEGISLLDPDIAALRFYRPMLPEMTVQFSNRTRAYGSKPIICFYVKREKFVLTGFDYDVVYQSIYNKQQSFSPANSNMARDYIDFEQQLMIYYSMEAKNKKRKKVYSAHIREKGTDQLDPLLLGYQALQRLEGLMNLDLFSVLYRLKDLGYEFAFSSREGSQIRKHFKDLRLAEHISIIKDDLGSILHEQYTLKSFLPGTPLAKAWALLQVIDLEYFLQMDENYKTELFSSKKQFNDFIEKLAGVMILQDKIHSWVYDFLGKEFKKMDAQVLSRIMHMHGFPKKIYHHDLMAEFKILDASVQKIKGILKKQFTVSKAKAGSSEKYFGLDEIHHDVTRYIHWDKLEGFTNNPFID